MPFIAIALAISVFLGGSAAIATTPLGHAAIDSAQNTWAHVEAVYSNELGVEADTEASEASSETTVEATTETSVEADTGASVEAEHSLGIKLF